MLSERELFLQAVSGTFVVQDEHELTILCQWLSCNGFLETKGQERYKDLRRDEKEVWHPAVGNFKIEIKNLKGRPVLCNFNCTKGHGAIFVYCKIYKNNPTFWQKITKNTYRYKLFTVYLNSDF